MNLGLEPQVSRAWPRLRGRRSSIAAQFGEDRADLLHRALTTADPPADAVVEEIHERGRGVRADLARGIATADELGLPRAAAAEHLLTPAFHAIRERRSRLRRNADAWHREQFAHLDEARTANSDTSQATGYEHEAALS